MSTTSSTQLTTAQSSAQSLTNPSLEAPILQSHTLQSKARKGFTVPEFKAHKGKKPLVCLTCYTAPMAAILAPYSDMLLVGDSLGTVVYGFDNTLPVTLEMMIAHGAAVCRKAEGTMVVVDLPFGSYQGSPEAAYTAAARVMQETSCAAVKIEGGEVMAETIQFLNNRGIPVLAHIGLQPQSIAQLGSYKAEGRTDDSIKQLRRDAKAVAEAGAFAVVLEAMVESVAAKITAEIAIPTIGIGASPRCDGQILVIDDVLGMQPHFTPKFVRRYSDLHHTISLAVQQYAEEVRHHRFPSQEYCYGVSSKDSFWTKSKNFAAGHTSSNKGQSLWEKLGFGGSKMPKALPPVAQSSVAATDIKSTTDFPAVPTPSNDTEASKENPEVQSAA